MCLLSPVCQAAPRSFRYSQTVAGRSTKRASTETVAANVPAMVGRRGPNVQVIPTTKPNGYSAR